MVMTELAPSALVATVTDLRREWFDTHVPWHRISSVVDITDDAGELIDDVLDDNPAMRATVIDVAGTDAHARLRLAHHGSQVQVKAGGSFHELPAAADYYLLPDGVEDLDRPRLCRLFAALAAAASMRSRALCCLPYSETARLIDLAESSGLEITRMGSGAADPEEFSAAVLVEFGLAAPKTLPID